MTGLQPPLPLLLIAAHAMQRAGRTNIKGTRAKKCKFKRGKFCYAFKFTVLKDSEAGLTNADILRKYPSEFGGKSVTYVRQALSEWNVQADLIALMAENVRTSSHLRFRETGLGTVLSTQAEDEIVAWINDLRQDGVPVSSKMLQLEALEVSKSHGVTDGFAAGPSWHDGFLDRHRLSFRTKNRAGQSSPDDDDLYGLAFALEVREWMAEHGVSRIFNADQTGVNFEMLPKKTVAQRGSSTVWVKCGKKEKERATAMLLADSDGNKYTPFVVFKTGNSRVPATHQDNVEKRHGFGRQLWKEIQMLQERTGLQIYGNRAAWWNADLTIAWMKHFFDDRTDQSEPVLLLLDSFSGHWTEEVQAYARSRNVFLKQVPPSLTWRCQLADVAWIKPLKDGLRRKWVDYLRDQLAARKARTVKFNMKAPNRGDVAEWITQGWEDLTESIIINGFTKCGFRDVLVTSEVEPQVEREVDTSTVIEALAELGEVDASVGEVSARMDVLDSVFEEESDVAF